MLQSKISVFYSPTGRRQFTRVTQPLETASNVNADSHPKLAGSNATLSLAEMRWFGNRVPNGYWDIRENRVLYRDWLGEQCGFVNPADWYRLRRHHFQQNNGGGLLRNVYGSSVLAAMVDYRPDYNWRPWLFGGAPNGFWSQAVNRHRYMDWLGQELGFSSTEDWYAVTGAHFFDYHGGGLLNNMYKGSVQAILHDYRPDFPWQAWRFHSVPQSFWSQHSNRRDYMSWLGEVLGFKTRDDWKSLNREHFLHHNGSGLFATYFHGSTQRAIAELFPEHAAAST